MIATDSWISFWSLHHLHRELKRERTSAQSPGSFAWLHACLLTVYSHFGLGFGEIGMNNAYSLVFASLALFPYSQNLSTMRLLNSSPISLAFCWFHCALPWLVSSLWFFFNPLCTCLTFVWPLSLIRPTVHSNDVVRPLILIHPTVHSLDFCSAFES